ncbi:MAG: DNA topoisomerase I [Alphaproteobacteria bacterium 33-17]|mgnify:CR=1 FL=1|nr:MAG: DNA topoisomerase I [Alphaproteobacteria bacterium 33-17]
MSKVLIVESPAKAKTINKYLPDFDVVATYGHIRDLPSKNGSVVPGEDFKMLYEINSTSTRHVDNIVKVCKNADEIYLATDPDREGESISWHVVEILKEKKAIKPNAIVKRVVFNAITKDSVKNAVKNPRDIDENLVNAQQARRALDYLVGFGISPILWRKLPGSKSAGRVQSVALRLICEREREIEKFKTQEYYTIEADFKQKTKFHAILHQIDGKKLEKFDLTKDTAENHLNAAKLLEYFVANVEKKKLTRNPQPPFTTSTLQQEASRKLGFSTKMTMQIAQKLYEGIKIGDEIIGLITYMRTDGVQIAPEALKDTRTFIETAYGSDYLPKSPRMYQTKAKNAQEAHEAIRPTSLGLPPEKVKRYLDDVQFKLYELIWKRLVSSQMESAILDSVTITSEDKGAKYSFKSTGSTIKFDGFYRVYREGYDDVTLDDETVLPNLEIGSKLDLEKIESIQHFTEPPPRFTEASLVKKLEELGIGRPSTYSSIISVIQDRKYVKLDKKRFIPEDRGIIVTTFLENFFSNYVEYGFTAELENKLDDVSCGEFKWKELLGNFWENFDSTVKNASNLKLESIIELLNDSLAEHFFGTSDLDARKCPSDGGVLGIRLSKFGAFIGCSNYPDCAYKRNLDQEDGSEGSQDGDAESASSKDPFPIKIGEIDGGEVTIRKGPYGIYVQQDVPGSKTPKRSSLPKNLNYQDVTFEDAKKLLSLPLEIGKHPETGEAIKIGIGKFGPYVLYNGKYTSIKKADFFNLSIQEAVDLIGNSEKKASTKKVSAAKVIEGYEIFRGGFGMLYMLKDGKRLTFPKKTKIDDVDLDLIKSVLGE